METEHNKMFNTLLSIWLLKLTSLPLPFGIRIMEQIKMDIFNSMDTNLYVWFSWHFDIRELTLPSALLFCIFD